MTPWLPYDRHVSPRAGLRLLCLHYAGGDASQFLALRNALDQHDILALPVQLPGRATRFNEPAFRSMKDLIPALATAILPYLTKRFALLGYSMGALIGFELARYLSRRCALHPVHLFVASSAAPQLSSPPVRPLHRAADAELLAWSRRYRMLGGPGAAASEELQALMLPALRSDIEVCETYVYESDAPLRCPVTGLFGARDPALTKPAMQAWSTQSASSFELHVFEGGHLFIDAATVPRLQRLIQEALSRR